MVRLIVLSVLYFSWFCGYGLADGSLSGLGILGPDYPRVFFFRGAEAGAARQGATYEEWRDEFSRLSGIMGKTLDEEVPGRSKNADFFTRFKKDNPVQAVLLHLNGNARDPRWEGGRFFAGHWLYFNGATISVDVPGENGESEIKVSDASLFRMNVGRYKNKNEDIGLCELGADGKPDWRRSEQVQLLAVSVKAGTIKVRRGCYGTKPLAFSAGKGYAAAHATEGPWGKQSNILWYYNYATCCPRDEKGRVCSDVWAGHIGELFNKGGLLAAFDGLEFDVLYNRTDVYEAGDSRGVDCDADGKPDGGIVNGVNVYGAGVIEFCRELRSVMGENRILQADAATRNFTSQRAFGLLNGAESEGFPFLGDNDLTAWSSGINRLLFWEANSRAPRFNYINHKFVTPTGVPGEPDHHPDVPMGIHRLVFAAAVFTDTAICSAYTPPGPKSGAMSIWDEMTGGPGGRVGWLGKPLGPVVHLAERGSDELCGVGKPAGTELLKRLSGEDARVELDGGTVKLTAKDPAAQQFRVLLKGIPCNGPDLFVSIKAVAGLSGKYPEEMARLMYVSVVDPGAKVRKKAKRMAGQPDGFVTYLNGKSFKAGFQFCGVVSRNVDIEITCEMAEPVWLEEVTVHARPDGMVRGFEHGMVLANPSLSPVGFNLAELAAGRSCRHIKGAPEQDPKMNDGSPVGGLLTLPPKDAVFLLCQ